MRLGLQYVPATFQLVVHTILFTAEWQYAPVHLEDIVSYLRRSEEHIKHNWRGSTASEEIRCNPQPWEFRLLH